MSLLADFPGLPPPDELLTLRSTYAMTLGKHVYLNDVSHLFINPNSALPPYLNLAFACIGRCLQGIDSLSTSTNNAPNLSDPDSATQFFHAGSKIFSVMVETDNREARTVELVLSVES